MKILSMPKGGTPISLLYDSGSWSVPYDNPGTYSSEGKTAVSATLNPAYVHLASDSSHPCMIGTANKIDLTDYTQLKIRAKYSGPGTTILLGVTNNKAVPNWNDSSNVLGHYYVTGSNSNYVEYTLDITALTGSYYISCTAYEGNRTMDFEKLWLE